MKWNWIGWQTSLLCRLRGSSRLGVNIIITWPQFNSNKRCYCDITVTGGRVRLKSSLQTMSWVSWLLPPLNRLTWRPWTGPNCCDGCEQSSDLISRHSYPAWVCARKQVVHLKALKTLSVIYKQQQEVQRQRGKNTSDCCEISCCPHTCHHLERWHSR